MLFLLFFNRELEIGASDDPLSPMVLRDLKRLEAERLREAIEQVVIVSFLTYH